MNDITLEFTVAIKAPSPALHNLQHQLNSTHFHHSILSEVLPIMIKETLLAAGATHEVEVELHPSQLINHYEVIGGLRGDLWLEANGSDHCADESMFIKIVSEDEILCSD